MLIFIFFVAAVGIIVALIIESYVDKEMERRREILINQVKSVCVESDTRFSVSGHFDRMERESQRIRDEIKSKQPYVLVLWWGDDGLRFNEDGTTEWISKMPKPRNAINPVFNPINTTINAGFIQSAPVRWQVESQIQSTEAQIAALQLQFSKCKQSAINSYLIEKIRPTPIPEYVSFARDSSGRYIRILATGQKIQGTVREEKISYPPRHYTMNGRPYSKAKTIKIVETNDEIQGFDGFTGLSELDGKYYLCANKLIEV